MRFAVVPGVSIASLLIAGLLLVLSLPPPVGAQAPAKPAAKPASKAPATKTSAQTERLDAAVRKLGSSDPEAVESGMRALVEHGGPLAERALTERVAAGLPPSLIAPALKALVALKARRSVPVVVELLQHRRALVRSQALLALCQLDTRKPSPLHATFIAALSDPASEVSGAAAQGLATIGTKASLPALWSAYDRGVTPALASIAELAGPESVDTLVTRVQASGGIDLLGTALDRMLARNALPTGAQVQLVRALAATKSDGARQYLLGWIDRIKLKGNPQVKQELFDALKALSPPAAPASPAATPPGGNSPPELAINKEGVR